MEPSNYNGALQQPIGSGFNAKSTASEVIKGINLTGKIAIVTGGNAGIGLETVKTLSQAGATIIVPARDVEKAKKNLQGITNVEIEEMDLMNPNSIDAFAERFVASGRPLHLLINNAGIMWVPLRRDSRGYESQLATNYLAQFQLTARLWTALKKADGARVVNVSSGAYRYSDFNFDDPNFLHRHFESMIAYAQSKTAVILFSLELDNYAKDHNIRSYSLCPGGVGGTDLTRKATKEMLFERGLTDKDGNILPQVASSIKTIPQGAATTVWVATSPLLNNLGGVFCENSEVTNLGEMMPYALSDVSAKKLWTMSEDLTSVKFQH